MCWVQLLTSTIQFLCISIPENFAVFPLVLQEFDNNHILLGYYIIIICLLLKYRLIFLHVLKVFDELLRKSNTEI